MNLPETMRAMVMEHPRQPLVLQSVPVPSPAAHQVLVKIIACGVCYSSVSLEEFINGL